jgi:hypothetical protein
MLEDRKTLGKFDRMCEDFIRGGKFIECLKVNVVTLSVLLGLEYKYSMILRNVREYCQSSQRNNNNKHTRKSRSEGTTENSHIGHCTHTAESANVEIQWSERRN